MNRKTKLVAKMTALLVVVVLLISSMITVYAEENVSLSDPEKVIDIATGYAFTMALKADGTVWAWGENDYGQLGDGTTISRNIPEQVKGLSKVIAVSASGSYSMALKEDGTVWTWGRNSGGCLGDGTTTDRKVPAKCLIPNEPVKVKAISAGGFGMALKEDGTVWTWGEGSSGQLGRGDRADYYPNPITTISNIKAISAGGANGLALGENGEIYSWGNGRFGQVGGNHSGNTFYPVMLWNGTVRGTAISAGDFPSMAVMENDGSVRSWGEGYLGNGTITMESNYVQVRGLTNVKTISATRHNTVAVKTDGTLWAWGSNGRGQVGDGTNIDRFIPVQLNGISNVTSASVGGMHTAAVCEDGSVWTWGSNLQGQLGDGTTSDRSVPRPIEIPESQKNTDHRYPLAIRLDERVQGEIEVIGESRYYSFTPTTTDTYRIQSVSDLDTYGEVFDSSGARIAWNDDGMGRGESGNLRDFYIESKLTANQTYLIRVNALDDGIGEFVLKVSK